MRINTVTLRKQQLYVYYNHILAHYNLRPRVLRLKPNGNPRYKRAYTCQTTH